MPTLAELEEWMERQLPPNLHDLPMKVTSTVQSYSAQLYSQLSDITPTYSQIESSIESSLHSIPFVGHAIVQSPPPAPPKAIYHRLLDGADAYTGSRARTSAVAVGVGVAGITYAFLASAPGWHSSTAMRRPRTVNGLRQEAVVVLGADTPLGQALCHHLSAQGLIVVASVANEQAQDTFQSLIPPSSRGYIKTLVLNPIEPQADSINHFAESVHAAREMRWPLTSAGDPYSRPGAEVDIVGIVNALSYLPAGDAQDSSSLHFDQMMKDMNQRVITPVSVVQALLPAISSSRKDKLARNTFVISLVSANADMSRQAILSAMDKFASESADMTSMGKRLHFTTIEARTSSEIFPLSALTWMSARGASRQNRTTVDDTVGSPPTRAASEQATEPANSFAKARSSEASSSLARSDRTTELRSVVEAVKCIILAPANAVAPPSRSVVQLTTVGDPSSVNGFYKSLLSRPAYSNILSLALLPFRLLDAAIYRLRLYPSYWWSRWSRPSCAYTGSRNENRPAFGPGPGPASNTHSRSCIRPTSSAPRESQSGKASSSRSKRPTSSHSNTSSENAALHRSGPSSTATHSGPPSNTGLSSSGLLSSVPSSAFGDVSEEEHFDSESGVESPVQGMDSWNSPVLSDNDSSTALGARNDLPDSTPSASRINQDNTVQYGFPSHESMNGAEDGRQTWMGPPMTGESSSSASPSTALETSATQQNQPNSGHAPGSQSPLGQSWVALGQSTLDQSRPSS